MRRNASHCNLHVTHSVSKRLYHTRPHPEQVVGTCIRLSRGSISFCIIVCCTCFPYSLYCMLRLPCTGLTIPYIPTAQPTRHLPASPPPAGSRRECQGRVVFSLFYRIILGFIYRVLSALPLCHQVLRLSDLQVRRIRRNRALLMLQPNIPWSFTRLRNRWLRLQRNL